jgi:predicted RNase H-like nuclease (RuvC/YqgF family)
MASSQANLTSTLQETQEDYARVSAELVSSQAQIEWLESQASGIETEELLRMVDGKDRTLEEKDTEIERLNSKLEETNRAARRHAEVRARRWVAWHEIHLSR